MLTKRNILYKGKPAVWPLPNQCQWQDGSLKLPEILTMDCDASFASEAQLFRQGMAELGIIVQACGQGATITVRAVKDGSIGDQGYQLDINPSGISLAANTNTGIFYSFQTLTQLIANSPGQSIPAVTIVDSPFKPLRGVHFYVPSRQNLPWFKKFLDFMAKYKINTIFLEIGASMKFDRHPEINEEWERFCKEMLVYPGGPDGNHWGDSGMQMLTGNIKDSVHIENGGGSYLEKHEMAEIVQWCRERHIEIIPEVQGLSHVYWMLLAHKDCAERSDDPYPDTWCPSNPRTYEIYFDCLQEIVDVIKPRTVSLGHDEYQWIGFCDKCREKTGHDIFAQNILKCYYWLKDRSIKTHVWSDKFYNLVKKDEVEIGMGSGGGKHLNYNLRTGTNELVKPTYRALDCMPEDLLISDWYYSANLLTQDMFNDRGMSLLFGNFHPGSFEDMEARLRRPNVIGAEVSLWHETSDAGMAMTDNLTKYLTAVNILWNKGYDSSECGQYNHVIAQIYPAERDRMNGVVPPSAASEGYCSIDISSKYNAPLNHMADYSYIATATRIPNTIPFDICRNVRDIETDAACLLTGDGGQEQAAIDVNGKFRSLAFLHSYTATLAGPPAHACTYVGWEEDIIGSYQIIYIDGSAEKVLLEYSRNIFTHGATHAFGAHRSNPVFQRRVLKESVEQLSTSKRLVFRETNFTVFAFEWVNPHPEKRIESIVISHETEKQGGIVLFGVTGIV